MGIILPWFRHVAQCTFQEKKYFIIVIEKEKSRKNIERNRKMTKYIFVATR